MENLVFTWTVFCKANRITETPYIFFGKVKNKIHLFVKALFLVLT